MGLDIVDRDRVAIRDSQSQMAAQSITPMSSPHARTHVGRIRPAMEGGWNAPVGHRSCWSLQSCKRPLESWPCRNLHFPSTVNQEDAIERFACGIQPVSIQPIQHLQILAHPPPSQGLPKSHQPYRSKLIRILTK